MKIEHITYDDAHGRTDARPSNTQKLKNYINTKLTKQVAEDDTQKLLSREGRPNSAPNTRYKAISEEDICAFLVRSHERSREEMATEETNKRQQNLGPSGYRASHKESNSRNDNWTPAVKDKVTLPNDVKLPFHQKSRDKVKYVVPGSAAEYLARCRAERAAMHQGSSSKDEVLAAQRLTTSPRLQNSSLLSSADSKTAARSATHERTTSSITSYLTTSADLLDSTRRGLASSVRKNAEKVISSKFTSPFHLDYHERQALIDDESDSDESFFCVGEQNAKPSTSFVDLERKRRLSGTGTNPWLTVDKASLAGICQLCRQRLVKADNRLCDICVHEIQLPNVLPHKEKPLKRKPVAKEVKPIPPLKAMKQVKKITPVRPKLPHIASMASTITTAPTPPPKESEVRNMKIESVNLKANVVKQAPYCPSPQHADIETVTPLMAPISRYEHWQTEDIRAEYAKAKEMFDRWSGSWEDEYVTSPIESPILSSFEIKNSTKNQREDEVAMLPQGNMQGRKRIKRNSSFYAFWNDLLGQEEI